MSGLGLGALLFLKACGCYVTGDVEKLHNQGVQLQYA